MVSEGSRDGFFRMGETLAVLKAEGKHPESREVLMRWVRKGRSSVAED